MARINDDDLFPIDQTSGMDNVSEETALAEKALRLVKNADVRRDGRVKRRGGYQSLRVGTRVSSLRSFGDGAVWLENGVLYYDHPPFTDPITLRNDLLSDKDLSYTEVNGELFYANGVQSGMVLPGPEHRLWTLPVPGIESVSTVAAGGLDEGTYQVTATFVDQWGRESGASLAHVIDVPSGEGIRIDGISVPDDADIDRVWIYMTEANGENLYWDSELPAGTTAAMIARGSLGAMLQTQFCEPMPPGYIVRYSNGRLLTAHDRNLYYSQPLNYALHRPHEDYVPFREHILMVEPVGDADDEAGVFVSDTKRTYFLPGSDIVGSSVKVVHPHSVVAGSSIQVPSEELGIDTTSATVPCWVSSKGTFLMGLPGGLVKPITKNVVADEFESGASMFRTKDGMRQILMALRTKTGQSAVQSSDYAIAEVRRNGKVI